MDTSEHSRYKDFEWAVELNRHGLEIIGLWPKFNKATKNNLASDLRMGITFSFLFLSIIPVIYSLKRNWGNMLLMIDHIQVILPFLVILLKLLIMRWKQTIVTSILTMMMEDWMESRTEVEKNVMIRRARTVRLIIVCGYVSMMFACTVMVILPSFGIQYRRSTNSTNRDDQLPLQAYYFYDLNKSPQFELTFVSQAVMLLLGAIVYTSVDGFLGLTIFHICGQLENFRRGLDNLVLYKNFNRTLCKNVETHLRLIRFAGNIENVFTLMILGLVFYFGIILCLYGFLLLTLLASDERSNMSLSLPRIIFLIVGAVVALSHTFLYYVAGEIITEHCEAVYRALSDLDWYKLEARQARNIVLLMRRAHEPFRITAGKVFPLTMASFCTLLKTSAGYISLLLAKQG